MVEIELLLTKWPKHLWATIKMFLGDDPKKKLDGNKKFQFPNLTIEITWSHSLAVNVFWLVNLATKN